MLMDYENAALSACESGLSGRPKNEGRRESIRKIFGRLCYAFLLVHIQHRGSSSSNGLDMLHSTRNYFHFANQPTRKYWLETSNSGVFSSSAHPFPAHRRSKTLRGTMLMDYENPALYACESGLSGRPKNKGRRDSTRKIFS
ncbi:hypothetical protein CDAR_254531 [Caerostris darwini]|uniref:Uncharacterized protein n=1 Tax=Caerostris darwini TaxID=1538125 RepID=A0AAV4UBA2_9ARAC|nr:hypothetical protein CDAR_254531 [Caerostris darwini]